jgi:hypothetical protein
MILMAGPITTTPKPGWSIEFNLILIETLLKFLMASCTDFEEKETILQAMASKMGSFIEQSSKCHCKTTGEGIEYVWALKNHYRSILLDRKQEHELFANSERDCLS